MTSRQKIALASLMELIIPSIPFALVVLVVGIIGQWTELPHQAEISLLATALFAEGVVRNRSLSTHSHGGQIGVLGLGISAAVATINLLAERGGIAPVSLDNVSNSIKYLGILFLVLGLVYRWSIGTQEITASMTNGRNLTEFELEQSVSFYDCIADGYNSRLKGSYHKTVAKISVAISKLLMGLPHGKNLRVLDLGGGTGFPLLNTLLDEPRLIWTNLDGSLRMTEQFRAFTKGAAIRADVLNLNLLTLDASFLINFDVAVMCFVLSSLPRTPDFSLIRQSMNTGGRLIIADINPNYKHHHPAFEVSIDDKRYVLHTRDIALQELLGQLQRCQFTMERYDEIDADAPGTKYAWLATFLAT
jgi:SAM-dependent methyltransferase